VPVFLILLFSSPVLSLFFFLVPVPVPACVPVFLLSPVFLILPFSSPVLSLFFFVPVPVPACVPVFLLSPVFLILILAWEREAQFAFK
jgi:hypothetical protein